MPLTQEQKKHFKTIGHHLKPVLIVADNGLTEGVLAELERALGDHELIKVQLRITEREDRLTAIDALCKAGKADLVQVIGKMALIYRKNPKVNSRCKARSAPLQPPTPPQRCNLELTSELFRHWLQDQQQPAKGHDQVTEH
jgi:RNA-binding protein